MKIERLWCVTDPSDPSSESEFGDVCFETTPRRLVASIIGAYKSDDDQVRIMQSMAMYTDESEAHADAQERLRRRDAVQP